MAAKVNETSAVVRAWQPALNLVCTLLGGTDAMRAAGKTYLPQWPAEDDDAYKARLSTAVLYPAYPHTITTLAAKPFSKPITIGEDVPTTLRGFCEDIDLEGRDLDSFAADIMEAAIGHGMAGIFVDHPIKPEGINTQADERGLGLRPYAVQIHKSQILGWSATRRNGRWVLLQLRFVEVVEEQDGAYGVTCTDQIRVLSPGAWETHRKNQQGEWVLYESGTTTLDYVPFVPVYGKRKGFMIGVPPLKDLADLNVKHWQSQSDQDTILHVARVPILTARQCGEQFELKVGASAAVDLGSGPNAELKYVEHSGAAIEAGKKSLDDLKDEMRQAGAEMLVVAQVQKTATEVGAEDSVGMCALQRIAAGVQDCLDQMLQIMADWIGETDGGHVKLFSDYGATTLAEATAQILLSANQAGKISDETFRAELKRRSILSPDVDEAEEADRIAQQGPSLGEMGGMDMEEAASQLDDAIALHQKHMNGTAPTTGPDGEKSQMLMMQQMKAARAALGGGSDNGDPSGGMGGM